MCPTDRRDGRGSAPPRSRPSCRARWRRRAAPRTRASRARRRPRRWPRAAPPRRRAAPSAAPPATSSAARRHSEPTATAPPAPSPPGRARGSYAVAVGAPRRERGAPPGAAPGPSCGPTACGGGCPAGRAPRRPRLARAQVVHFAFLGSWRGEASGDLGVRRDHAPLRGEHHAAAAVGHAVADATGAVETVPAAAASRHAGAGASAR